MSQISKRKTSSFSFNFSVSSIFVFSSSVIFSNISEYDNLVIRCFLYILSQCSVLFFNPRKNSSRTKAINSRYFFPEMWDMIRSVMQFSGDKSSKLDSNLVIIETKFVILKPSLATYLRRLRASVGGRKDIPDLLGIKRT